MKITCFRITKPGLHFNISLANIQETSNKVPAFVPIDITAIDEKFIWGGIPFAGNGPA